MSTPVPTPDWQRGVVSAQQLLGSFGIADRVKVVGIPPNTEALVITLIGITNDGPPTVQGNTSSLKYAVIPIFHGNALANATQFVVPASQALDDTVTITWSAGPGEFWYVHTSTGTQVVTDSTLATIAQQASYPAGLSGIMALGSDGAVARVIRMDPNGEVYTVAVPPGNLTGDHPLNEIQAASAVTAASADIMVAPGAGRRYRIFGAKLLQIAAAANPDIRATQNGQFVYLALVNATTQNTNNTDNTVVPLSGLATDANTPVHLDTSGSCAYTVFYTVENV